MEQVHDHDSGDDDDDTDPSEDATGIMKSARTCYYVCCLLATLITPPLVDDILARTEIVQDLEQFREFEVEHDDRVNVRQESELATDERESTVCMNVGGEVEIEAGQADKTEETVCSDFLNEGCGCHLKCSSRFSPSYLREVRQQMAELSKDELDLVVIGEILSTIHDGDTTVAQGIDTRREPDHQHNTYTEAKGYGI